MKKDKDIIRTTVSLSAETHRTIEDISKQKKVSLSWVLREAVEKYVAEKEPNSITDQSTPVKANDLKAESSPKVEIPTTSDIDVGDLGKGTYAEVDSEYAQILDLLNRYEHSERPVACTVLIKKMIPMSKYISDEGINKIKLLATITEIEDLIDTLNSIGGEPDNDRFRNYISNEISTTISMALKYRYSNDVNIFHIQVVMMNVHNISRK